MERAFAPYKEKSLFKAKDGPKEVKRTFNGKDRSLGTQMFTNYLR